MSPAEEYAKLERQLMIWRFKNLEEFEDVILEKMDILWWQMSPEERADANERVSIILKETLSEIRSNQEEDDEYWK